MTSRLVHRLISRFLSVVLVLALLCNSTPAAPQTIVAVSTEWGASLAFWWNSNGIPAKVYGALAGQNPSRPRPQERQRERDARVSRIQIHPGDVTVQVDEAVRFAAVGYDQESFCQMLCTGEASGGDSLSLHL